VIEDILRIECAGLVFRLAAVLQQNDLGIGGVIGDGPRRRRRVEIPVVPVPAAVAGPIRPAYKVGEVARVRSRIARREFELKLEWI